MPAGVFKISVAAPARTATPLATRHHGYGDPGVAGLTFIDGQQPTGSDVAGTAPGSMRC